MNRVKVDYERFVQTPNAFWLYKMFKNSLYEQKEGKGFVELSDVMPYKDGAASPDDARFFFYMAVLYSFEASNKQVYRLGKNLAHMFLDTKLPKLSLDDVKLPFPCFYLTIPEELNLCIGDARVHGCYMFDSRDEDNPMAMTVTRGDTHESFNQINFIMTYHKQASPNVSGDDTIGVMSLDPGEKDLENYIKVLKGTTMDAEQIKLRETVIRLALNLVFYLNSSEREIGIIERPDASRIRELQKKVNAIRKSRKKLREKAERKLETEKNKVIVTVLAPTVERKEHYESERLSTTPVTGHTKRRHMTSGFYNYYWCSDLDESGKRVPGKKHLESRWIKPHWRGKDVGEAIRRRYEVIDPEPQQKDRSEGR